MYLKKLIILIFILSTSLLGMGQNKLSKEIVDVQSYQLYENAKWDELISYGNKALQEGIDFNFLRLRLGYAFVMKQQFCEALIHYDIILNKDKFNEIARYYEWFCRINLNQADFASLNAVYFSKETKKSEKISPFSLTSIGFESSYKFTSVSSRGNALYNAIKINSRLGWRFNMSHNFIGFNQQINEPKLIYVNGSNAIKINQKEYYNLTSINLNNRFQLKASYHYLQTPFNNFIYNNHVGMLGLKYYNHYFNLQANAIVGKLIDSSIQQFEFQSEYYPSGNLNVYGNTTLSVRIRNNEKLFNLKDVLGVKLNNHFWLEGHITIGKFNNRFENDASFVYNAIDANISKYGATLFYFPNKNLTLQAGILSEKRELYQTNYLFNQQSINGGISWKF